MTRRAEARITKPTITEVLAQFLSDQRGRVAAKTFGKYKDAVDLLQDCLNNYAYQTLDKPDAKLFERLYSAKGEEHREFCDIFGPGHILPNVGEFLDYFMVRKVIAGKETLRAAGTMTKRLAAWLAEKGYVEKEDAEEAAEHGGASARNLPKAEELASRLHRFAEDQEQGDGEDEIEDHFTITRVEAGRVWLRGLVDGRDLGLIRVPEDVSSRCSVGWTISGVVGRAGRSWRIVEVWNVYPR